MTFGWACKLGLGAGRIDDLTGGLVKSILLAVSGRRRIFCGENQWARRRSKVAA
jgi:hypothetical protein